MTFEAAASGLPILATPVSGVRELIEDGRNGYLITRDPVMIAERLGRLGEDAELRARLGAAARESALAFSWERMVREHERPMSGSARHRGVGAFAAVSARVRGRRAGGFRARRWRRAP